MHVDVRTESKTSGFFKKETTYYLYVTVTFSEEEKAIIKREKLHHYPAFEWDNKNMGVPVKVNVHIGELLKGPSRVICYTPHAATSFQENLKDQLSRMAEFIRLHSKGSPPNSTSFDV